MKKLFLTFTALSTLLFFSCASKPEASQDADTNAPASEAELSDIEEPEITDLPPEEESELADDEVEFVEADQLDELPELDDENISDAENAEDEAALLNTDGESADGTNAEKAAADAEAQTQSDGTDSTGEGAQAGNETSAQADGTTDSGTAGEGILTADEALATADGSESDADALEDDAADLEDDTATTNGSSITPSRSVTMKVTEYLDVSYPGKGWIYMGATDNSKNIMYFGRQLGTENTNFSLQARQPGRKILHFYKNDAVSGQIIDDYIEVIVQTERGSSATHIEAPAFKMPVRAKRPVLKLAEKTVEVSPAIVEYDDSNDDVELLEEPKPVSKSSQKTENGGGNAEASRQALPSASDNAANGDSTLSSNEKSQKDLSKLLTLAKTQLTEKKYSEALKNINEYLGGSSDSRDEALYVQGQILEAKSDIQDISGAINSYTTLTKNYPASKFWDKANKRIIYLKRFYLQGR
ncbi:outer membrane protein assembly factor BamD [Treponema sp. C6A8]|uniref:outer membrane protein assembly factor BamD n=1 Tax=Treponema sp. C6A8 TaxID=1410609 RepID=UPI000480C9A6|nr:outer membrane protein assembly factor BamD [Treponema sp. C6A8]